MRSLRSAVLPKLFAASVVAAGALASREAAAADPMGPKIEKGLFLPVGLNLGYSVNTPKGAANGFILGGETSLAFFKDLFWTGAYADILRDFGEQETRTSVGLEAGYGPVGVDFGYLGAFRDETAHGVRVRGILTASAISVYGGYARTWTDARTHAEFGVLLKVPLPIFIQEVKKKPDEVVPPPPPPPIDEPKPAPAPTTPAEETTPPAETPAPTETKPAETPVPPPAQISP